MPQLPTSAPPPSTGAYADNGQHPATSTFTSRLPTPAALIALASSIRSPRTLWSKSRRKKLLHGLMKSHRISLNRFEDLPLRIRPWFVVFTVVVLIILGVLGFHPTIGNTVPVPDKLLHFVGFFVATVSTFLIWDVDDPYRRIWYWRQSSMILTSAACLLFGGLLSELVQSLLPHKQFSYGDVIANELGALLGLWAGKKLDAEYRRAKELSRLYLPVSGNDADGGVTLGYDEETDGASLLSTEDGEGYGEEASEGGGGSSGGARGTGSAGVAKKSRKRELFEGGTRGGVWDSEVEAGELFSLGDDNEDDEGQGRSAAPTDPWMAATAPRR